MDCSVFGKDLADRLLDLLGDGLAATYDGSVIRQPWRSTEKIDQNLGQTAIHQQKVVVDDLCSVEQGAIVKIVPVKLDELVGPRERRAGEEP